CRGIGRATARIFAENGLNLIICGRRRARVEELQKELGSKVAVHSLVFDIRDKLAVFNAYDSLPRPFSKIDILVNNAANAHGLSPIDQGEIDDWEAMMDINVKGLLYISKVIIPSMIENNTGQIINIGSTAGKEVYPGGNVYCASKHAVDAINQAMRIDLNQYGIRVGAINPGLVETEFSEVRFKGDRERAKKVYQGFTPLTPEDVAEIIYFAISRPPHV